MRRSLFVKTFGERIRKFRTTQGLSQEALGERASLHRNFVSMVERGERSVTLDTIERLAFGLQVHPSELMPDVTIKPKKPRGNP